MKNSKQSQNTLPPSGLAANVLQGTNNTLSGSGKKEPDMSIGAESIYAFADKLQDEAKDKFREKTEEHFETWVTFTLSGESFGLPVSSVKEILRVSAITKVPHTPESVRGITNIRGKVLPVVDLRIRLGMSQVDVTSASRILVVESLNRLIGLCVDSVQQVVRLSANNKLSVPPDVMTVNSDYITGVYRLDDGLIILLNVDRLLLLREQQSVTFDAA